ncbi:hypothetical protein NDU88_010229 [Pleurodeles waltl]|uniref:Uncharacterized protein n=1 Tax=Pleurodeles waltl TaxID=8319 RepID=A0AAV7QWW3_PLEWA|nr:hypothetical protein NDU88_010229 [Pleurodeles waltl]
MPESRLVCQSAGVVVLAIGDLDLCSCLPGHDPPYQAPAATTAGLALKEPFKGGRGYKIQQSIYFVISLRGTVLSSGWLGRPADDGSDVDQQQPDGPGGTQSPILGARRPKHLTDLDRRSWFHRASDGRSSAVSSGPQTPWAAIHSPGATATPPPPVDPMVQAPPLSSPSCRLNEEEGPALALSSARTQLRLLGKAFLLRWKWLRVDGPPSPNSTWPCGEPQSA